ncbi:WXG100 family type VII secretion target [Streptomyces sp. C36]|uniref:WXG100 family type VII secretion target n=1 Tax=Streptomyces sp. C36 TaxID=3237122 RepID=UPI0034C5F4B3
MSGQSINYETFAKFENTIGEVTGHLSKNLQNLANLLETVRAGWQGEGANAFVTAQRALNDDHDALRRLIDGIHQAASATRRATSANDHDVLASFKGIDVNGAAAGGHLGGMSQANGGTSDVSAGLTSKIDSYSL